MNNRHTNKELQQLHRLGTVSRKNEENDGEGMELKNKGGDGERMKLVLFF